MSSAMHAMPLRPRVILWLLTATHPGRPDRRDRNNMLHMAISLIALRKGDMLDHPFLQPKEHAMYAQTSQMRMIVTFWPNVKNITQRETYHQNPPTVRKRF